MLDDILKKCDSILVAPHYEGAYSSMIATRQNIYHSTESVNYVVDYYCKMFGSSLEGRLSATRDRLEFRKNPPILVSESNEIVGFQVPLMYYNEPMWIFDLDFKIKEINCSKCKIIYSNELMFEIPLSENAVRNRKNRALVLLHEFTKNKGFPSSGT